MSWSATVMEQVPVSHKNSQRKDDEYGKER